MSQLRVPTNPGTLLRTGALDASDPLLSALAGHISVVTAEELAAHKEQRQAHEEAKADEADLLAEYKAYLDEGDTAVPAHEWPAGAPSFSEWRLLRSQGAHSGHRDRPIRPIVITPAGDRDHAARLDRGVPGGRHGRYLVVTTDGCAVSFFSGVRQEG
jgi:hypothetical protein